MNNGTKIGLLLGTIALSTSAFGEDIRVRPYASLGYQMYELTATQGNQEFRPTESDYVSLGGGISVSNGPIYADINITTSLSAEWEEPGDSGDLERDDLSLAVGYQIEGGYSVFGGYKTGTTDMSQIEVNSNPIGTASFEADGVFFGGGYGQAIDDSLQFGVSLAVAVLDGEWKFGDGTTNLVYDSDTTVGVSFGGSLTKLLSDNLSLTGFVKFQSYSFSDGNVKVNGVDVSNTDAFKDYEVDEDLTSFGVSLNMHL